MHEIDQNISEINLRRLPSPIGKTVTQFTVGDLHANAIKLIYTLVRYGVCELDATSYNELIFLYDSSPPHSAENIKKWEKIIQEKLIVTDKGKNTLVRLIGDMLADRGANDWFVLTVLEKLSANGVQIRTLMSNHDNEFIQAFLQADKAFLPDGTPLADGQSQSYENFKKCIDNGNIDYDIAQNVVNKRYLNTLFLVDYSVGEDGRLTLFTHAPADLDAIKKVAKYFGVPYKDDPQTELTKTLDVINQEFKFLVQSGHLNDAMQKGSVLYTFFWRREGNLLANDDAIKESVMTGRESGLSDPRGQGKNEGITFVHGHSKSAIFDDLISPTNVHRIDNQLGKAGLENTDKTHDVAFISDDLISPVPVFDSTVDRSNKTYLVSIEQKQVGKLKDRMNKVRQLYTKEQKKDPESAETERQLAEFNRLADEIQKLEVQQEIKNIQNRITTTEQNLSKAIKSLEQSELTDPSHEKKVTQRKVTIITMLRGKLEKLNVSLNALIPTATSPTPETITDVAAISSDTAKTLSPIVAPHPLARTGVPVATRIGAPTPPPSIKPTSRVPPAYKSITLKNEYQRSRGEMESVEISLASSKEIPQGTGIADKILDKLIAYYEEKNLNCLDIDGSSTKRITNPSNHDHEIMRVDIPNKVKSTNLNLSPVSPPKDYEKQAELMVETLLSMRDDEDEEITVNIEGEDERLVLALQATLEKFPNINIEINGEEEAQRPNYNGSALQ